MINKLITFEILYSLAPKLSAFMKKPIALFTSIIILAFSSFAQISKVSGSLNDLNENKPVKNAVIALLIPKDSILYKFSRSDAEGRYVLKNVKPGNYILMTTHP